MRDVWADVRAEEGSEQRECELCVVGGRRDARAAEPMHAGGVTRGV